MNDIKSLALFELKMLELFGLRPNELEEIDMYTINTWVNEKKRKHIETEQKRIFEKMKSKGGKNRRTNN